MDLVQILVMVDAKTWCVCLGKQGPQWRCKLRRWGAAWRVNCVQSSRSWEWFVDERASAESDGTW